MQNKSKDYSKEWSEYKSALEANLKTELKGFCRERGCSYRSMQDWIYRHHYKVSNLKKEIQARSACTSRVKTQSFIEIKQPEPSQASSPISRTPVTVRGYSFIHGNVSIRMDEIIGENLKEISDFIKEVSSCSL